MLKSTFIGLQRCRSQYGSICLLVVASQANLRNPPKIRTYSSSRSSKLIDLGVNRKRICDFLLVINSNLDISPIVFDRGIHV